MFTKVQSYSNVIQVSIIAIVFLISSCKKDEDPITPPADPSETQKHIDWSSLAKSPWPMYGGGPQFTFRSDYEGPKNGSIDWEISIPNVSRSQAMTSPVIGADSTIYFVSSFENLPVYGPNAQLYAVSHDGKVKWKRRLVKDSSELGWFTSVTTPTVLSDGSIIVATPYNLVLSFSRDGNLNWFFEIPSKSIDSKTIVANKTGELYFVDQDGILYCLNNNGTLKWTRYVDFGFSQNFAPSISPDGLTLYLPGANGSKTLYAYTMDGDLNWTFDIPKYTAAYPLIDNNGNIYFATVSPRKDTINSFVYSLNNNGGLRWKYKITSQYPSNLVLDHYGKIYFIDDNGTSAWIVCIDIQGNMKWTTGLSGGVLNDLCIDKSGSLYIYTNQLFKYSNDGKTITPLPVFQPIWTLPAIGIDNSLIVTSVGLNNTFLTKIK